MAQRETSIDFFRGFCIILMVFFSLILAFSDSLPDMLTHNEQFSLHFGDFVLPMFLFASGMSIHHFRNKISGLKATTRAFFVAERFSRITMVWFFISPFTAGLFQMDELILSGILFIPTYLLALCRDRTVLLSGMLCIGAYFALSAAGMLPDFSSHYLGGFGAAPFYLPVMLGGLLLSRNPDKTGIMTWSSGALSAVFVLVIPPYKLYATPAFIILSIFASLVIFTLVRGIRSSALEYIGRKPLRYWVLMSVVIVVPLKLYVYFKKLYLPFDFDWLGACAISLFACVVLAAISLAIDRIGSKLMVWLGREPDNQVRDL
jgi:hypothetical protein